MHIEREVTGDHAGESVYVYEAPIRFWHWLNVVCLMVLATTGYTIGSPWFPNPPGEATHYFWFGYVRFTHFTAAYLFAIGFLMRVYWAFAGNRHAHQIFFVPVRDQAWWRAVGHQVRWYLWLERQPQRYLGHNPLAQAAILVGFVLPALFMLLTGFALYSEGKGHGGWHDALFGWVLVALGGSQNVHTVHHVGMWVLICFSILHIYIVVREDVVSRQSILASMVTGWRTFRD